MEFDENEDLDGKCVEEEDEEDGDKPMTDKEVKN